MNPGWSCPRRVGFLFPHNCHRTSPEGCPDCQNGAIEDPYNGYDRWGYSSYDDYGDDYYVAYGAASMIGASQPYDTSMEFTEADGADLVKQDEGFENDMTES